MRLMIPLCRLNRHRPNRDATWWDGLHYVSHCLDCGVRVRRERHRLWRRDWMEDEASPKA